MRSPSPTDARDRDSTRTGAGVSPRRGRAARSGRPSRAGTPGQGRLAELDAVTVPVRVVQGERGPCGMPPPGPTREGARVVGDHGLKADPAAVAAAVREWLPTVAGVAVR